MSLGPIDLNQWGVLEPRVMTVVTSARFGGIELAHRNGGLFRKRGSAVRRAHRERNPTVIGCSMSRRLRRRYQLLAYVQLDPQSRECCASAESISFQTDHSHEQPLQRKPTRVAVPGMERPLWFTAESGSSTGSTTG